MAATAALSSVLFDEAFTAVMVLGLVLIVGGVVLVEVGSHPPQEDVAVRWVFLVFAILTEVSATLSLRVAASGRRGWYVAVLAGYLASFVLLSLALHEGMGIGVVYGIWTAVGVALTAVLSKVLFGEPLTRVMALGLLLIIGGVAPAGAGPARSLAGDGARLHAQHRALGVQDHPLRDRAHQQLADGRAPAQPEDDQRRRRARSPPRGPGRRRRRPRPGGPGARPRRRRAAAPPRRARRCRRSGRRLGVALGAVDQGDRRGPWSAASRSAKSSATSPYSSGVQPTTTQPVMTPAPSHDRSGSPRAAGAAAGGPTRASAMMT